MDDMFNMERMLNNIETSRLFRPNMYALLHMLMEAASAMGELNKDANYLNLHDNINDMFKMLRNLKNRLKSIPDMETMWYEETMRHQGTMRCLETMRCQGTMRYEETMRHQKTMRWFQETMRDQETNSEFIDNMIKSLDFSKFRAKMEKMLHELWEIIKYFKIDMESMLEQMQTYRFTANIKTMLDELNQKIIPKFRAYIERMLNNLNQEIFHGFRADMKTMLNNLDQVFIPQFKADEERMLNNPYQEIIYEFRADMETMLNNLNQKIIPQFKFCIETILNNLNKAIIPFKANIETAILDDLPRPWNTNMKTMFNINHLEMISQFGANMNTMLCMQERETNRDPEDPEYGPLYGDNMLSWIIALSPEFAQGYWTRLQDFVNLERSKHMVFPPEKEVFTWMKYCPLDQIKVVIIGQDPYPKPGKAHGLCFSVKKQFSLPVSLINIFEELKTDVDFVNPGHGDLTDWAKQGVLLLNAVLTVRSGKAGSHKDIGWEIFTNRVVSLISERNSEVVFLLWGEDAKRKRRFIDEREVLRNAPHPMAVTTEEDYKEFPKSEPKHLVLTDRHPAYKKEGIIEFLGCGHFSKTNAWLATRNPPMIDWQI